MNTNKSIACFCLTALGVVCAYMNPDYVPLIILVSAVAFGFITTEG